jgi:hypothetical protein
MRSHEPMRANRRAPRYRDEGVLRLFLADALPPEQQLELVRRLADRARKMERRVREEIIPVAERMDGGRTIFPAITARLGADLAGFAAEWMGTLEAELRTNYSMPSSPPAVRIGPPTSPQR